MKQIFYITILFAFIFECKSQQLISREMAIEEAIEFGIKEPLDSFNVILKNDSIWEVHSTYCEDYYGSKSEIFYVNLFTGEKLNMLGRGVAMSRHSRPRPSTKINYDFVDSLLDNNKYTPVTLLEESFEYESNPVISPDKKWIAFKCGYRAIAVATIDGNEVKKVCDNCLYPQWTEKENVLIYEKNFKRYLKHNIKTDEIIDLTNNQNRYLYFNYCPTGKWISYVKPIQRKSDRPNEIIMCMEDQCYELFVKSLDNENEKRITYEGSVSSPVWNRTGDTIFFYLDRKAYFATDFESNNPIYRRATHLDNINIWDYSGKIGNKFIIKHDCQLILIDAKTLKPEKYINKKHDRYEDINISSDGRLIVYSVKKNGKEKIYILEND